MATQLSVFNDVFIETGAKPPLKWAGGKRWLIPYLVPIWNDHRQRRLVDPLCGGLAVPLALKPARALLNDINPHLINFYQWLQKGLKIKLEMTNDEATFYKYRKRFNALIRQGKLDTKRSAEYFYYLNRTCYNGLCRFNRRGEFNVPFGKYKRINYLTDFAEYKRALAGWQFSHSDFQTIELDKDDFVYADPPYDVEFTSYSQEDFRWHDQVRLAEWLAKHEGPVVVSNQATERIQSLYVGLGFQLTLLDAPRMISCTGDRTPAKEILATKGLT